MTERRAKLLLVLLVLAVGALLFTAPGRGYWVIDPDASAYVGLARSLVAGDGYTLQGIPHAKFPPGFPLLLSIAIRLTGDRECYGAMRDVTMLMGLLNIILAFAVARRVLRLSPGGSLFIAFSTAVSIYLLQYTASFLRSETTFTAFLLAAVVAGERWRERGGARSALLTGLCVAGAMATRSAGIVAIAALAIARLLRRPTDASAPHSFAPRMLEVALFAGIGIAPAVIHGAYVSIRSTSLGIQSSSYGDELFARYALDLTKDIDDAKPKISPFSSAMLERVNGNLAALALSLGKFVLDANKGANLATNSQTGRMHPGGYALLALLCVGLVVAVRRRLLVAVLLTTFYIGLYLIWPFNQQQRFYQPIAPILLGLLGLGVTPFLAFVAACAARALGRIALGSSLLLLVVVLASQGKSDVHQIGSYSYSYVVLMAAPALAGIAFLALALVPRWQGFDLARQGSRLRPIGLSLLSILWIFSFLHELSELRTKHIEFERQRREHPVPPMFAKIKVQPELIEILEKLLAAAKPGDVVMSDIPKMIHEMTGMKTAPFRFDSAKQELVLDTPFGRPRFLYFSREIPQVTEVFDHVMKSDPKWLVPVHSIDVKEGTVATRVVLYRVLDEDETATKDH